MSAENIRFTLDGIEYLWGGGFGATLISFENNCKLGELRIVNKHILKVFMITHYLYRKDRVCWCSADDHSHDWLVKFKQELFA